MNWSASDVVAVAIAFALCVMITFPMFRNECMNEQASAVYEQLVTAAIAVVATYIGAQINRR